MPENPDQSPLVHIATPPPLPPVEKKPWNAWFTLLWAATLFILWQVVMTVGIVIAAFRDGTFTNFKNPKALEEALLALSTDGDVIGLIVFSTIFFVCPACWLIGHFRPGYSGWEYLGNARPKWWHWPLWGAATIACSALFNLIAPFIGIEGPDESMVQMARSTQSALFLYLGVGIGAPLVEEFMFRGTLWRGWRESRMGLRGTLLLTSFCWAILHVQYPGVIIAYIFVLGLVLGLAREKTGSLWVPIWMHALNNGLATIEMLQL